MLDIYRGPSKQRLAVVLAVCISVLVLWRDVLTRSVWYDETATVDYASMPWPRFWTAIHHGDAFYALYYACMHLWISLFGTSPLALRSPSLLAALAAIGLTWLCMRALFGTVAAALASTLLVLNGSFVLYATEARAYTALILVSTALTYFLWRATEGDKDRAWWWAYTALAVLALYIHLYAAFVVAAHVVYLAVTGQYRAMVRCMLIGLAAGIAVSPMVLLAMHDENSQNAWLQRPSLKTLTYIAGTFAGSRWLWRVNLALAVVGAVLGLRSAKRRETTLLLCWALVPLVCIYALGRFRPDFRAPYVLEMLTAYVALYALGALSLRRFAYPAAVTLVLLHMLVLPRLERPANQDWNGAAALLHRDNAPVVILPQQGYASLQYAAPDEISRVVYPVAFRIDHSEALEPLINGLPRAFPAHAEKLWVIYDSHTNEDPEIDPVIPSFKDALRSRYEISDRHRLSFLSVVEYRVRTLPTPVRSNTH